MGCFLACFGFSNKRNRRKPANKRHGSYEPLDSPITILSLDNADSECEPRNKPKEQLSSKIRKKVSFNLNVQIYEPISADYHFLSNQENDAKTARKENEETVGGGSSNLNYRYQNCGDFYDEEDDIAFEDSDLDDYEDDYDFVDDNDNDNDITFVEEKADGDKSNYTHSVLKPVENLSQWRAAKAKEASPAKPRDPMKENILSIPSCKQSEPLLREITVNSSLSSWLNSSST